MQPDGGFAAAADRQGVGRLGTLTDEELLGIQSSGGSLP